MNKTYEVSVYNTMTGKYEKVSDTKEVYELYTRTEWNMRDADKRYYAHEIQFSTLIGGEDGAYENFREFIDMENTPDSVVEKELQAAELRKAIAMLNEAERQVVQKLYFEGLTEQKIASQLGVSQQVINRKKHRILKNLKKFLSEGV